MITAAAGAPTAVDIQIDIAVGPSETGTRFVPNGGTATVTGLTFWAGPEVNLITPEPATAKVRFELSEGLRWGRDEPDPTEQCTSTPSTGVCETLPLAPIGGQSGFGWAWELVAERPGSYVLRAEIIEASDSDPVTANNTSVVTVVVTETAPPPTPGNARVGAAKLSPAKPKAGSTVVASVRMTAGGSPVRPSSVTCTGKAGTAKLRGTGRAGNGSATCTYRTPRKAKGKMLRGAISFTVLGAKFTRRFSAKLG